MTRTARSKTVVVGTVAASLLGSLGLAGAAISATAANTDTSSSHVSANDATYGSVINTFDYDGQWRLRTGTAKYQGDDHASSTAGDSYLYRFRGTRFALVGAVGPNGGQASVKIHNGGTSKLDAYAKTAAEGRVLYSSPTLPYGYHVVKVTVTKKRNAASSGTLVAIDRGIADTATVPGDGAFPVQDSQAPSDGATPSEPAPTTTTTAPAPAPSEPAPTTTTAPAPTTTTTAPAPSTTVTADAAAGSYLVMSRDKLLTLPTSGSAWNTLLSVANGSVGSPDLANQDNVHSGRTVAAAMVYARTGQTTYRDKVVGELRKLPSSSISGARVLSVARQMAGYAIAADLVGYRDPAFVSYMGDMRTRTIGGHSRWTSVSQTSENTASNWGAWAMASRIALSRYVGDKADVARAATVFKGWTGDRSAYAGFETTQDFDASWACNPSAWVPINPASCGAKAGAIVEDISRTDAAFPAVDDTGRTYSWETLGGATLSARLLARGGYPDVYQWSDQALLRAGQFLQRNGGYAPLYTTNQYIPWEINTAYGVNIGPVNPAGFGRQFGFTDWLR